MLGDQPSLTRVRVVEAAEVVQIYRRDLRQLVQTDFDLSEILVRALILRRLETCESIGLDGVRSKCLF